MTDTVFRRSWRCGPQAVGRLLRELGESGGTSDGGPAEGRVAVPTPLGPIEGRYLYDGETLAVTVTRKPGPVPIGMIWDRLDRVCGEPAAEA